jgi:hypothetical protein
MRIFLHSIVGITLAAAFSGYGSADDRPYAPLDTQIRRVESGGSWQEGKRSGRYRAVIRSRFTGEHGYDDLFVEWLEEVGSSSKIAATKRVEEVGGLTFVSLARIVYSKDGTRLEVRHQSPDVEMKWTFCLKLGGPGKWTSEKGPCRGAG